MIEAAAKKGVKKFILLTSIGVGDSKDAPPQQVYDVLKPVLVEKGKAEEKLKVRCLIALAFATPKTNKGQQIQFVSIYICLMLSEVVWPAPVVSWNVCVCKHLTYLARIVLSKIAATL